MRCFTLLPCIFYQECFTCLLSTINPIFSALISLWPAPDQHGSMSWTCSATCLLPLACLVHLLKKLLIQVDGGKQGHTYLMAYSQNQTSKRSQCVYVQEILLDFSGKKHYARCLNSHKDDPDIVFPLDEHNHKQQFFSIFCECSKKTELRKKSSMAASATYPRNTL